MNREKDNLHPTQEYKLLYMNQETGSKEDKLVEVFFFCVSLLADDKQLLVCITVTFWNGVLVGKTPAVLSLNPKT